MLLPGPLIRLKLLHLRALHQLHDIIRLPLLKAKPQTVMTIILLIRLILMILDLHEVLLPRRRIQTQADQGIDARRLGQALEGPGLRVLELDHLVVGPHDLVAEIGRVGEEFGEGEPLPGHLVAVVGVHELVVVHAVPRVALHFGDAGLAGVEVDDVVHQALSRRGEGQRFGGVRGVVFARGGLTGLEVLAGEGGVLGHGLVGHCMEGGGER